MWKHFPSHAVYKYISKKILSDAVKKNRAIYIRVCAIVTTHIFCFPKSAILLCLVVIMWSYTSHELPQHQLSFNLWIASLGWSGKKWWSNIQKINNIKIIVLTYLSLWGRFTASGWLSHLAQYNTIYGRL